MRTVVAWLAAVVLGALAPAALVALADWRLFLTVAAVTLGHAVILGLPTALLYRRLKWASPEKTLAGGFLIGAIPVGIYLWPVDPTSRVNAWSGSVQTTIDGMPTGAGWVEYLQLLGGFGCLGMIGALAFWLTLKLSGQLKV